MIHFLYIKYILLVSDIQYVLLIKRHKNIWSALILALDIMISSIRNNTVFQHYFVINFFKYSKITV